MVTPFTIAVMIPVAPLAELLVTIADTPLLVGVIVKEEDETLQDVAAWPVLML